MFDEELECCSCFRELTVKLIAFLRIENGERSPLSVPLFASLWQNGHGFSRKRFCEKNLGKPSRKFAFYQNRPKLLLLLIFLTSVFKRSSYFLFSIFIEIRLRQFCGYFLFLFLTFLYLLSFIEHRRVAFPHVNGPYFNRCWIFFSANQWTGFYMIGTIVMKELSLKLFRMETWRLEGTLMQISEAATGSCSFEKVFLTISDSGNKSCSEYILVLFLLGNWPVTAVLMVNWNFCWETDLFWRAALWLTADFYLGIGKSCVL